jgi:flagellar M-ring protein FliF
MLVLRPMVVRLTAAPARLEGPGADALALAATGGAGHGGPAALLSGAPGGVLGALAGPGQQALLEDESMINIESVHGAIRASAIRRVADLIDRHPEETLAIMRGWMVPETQ